MSTPPIDLRSDTVTRPCPAMREAMASAEVGDDVFGDDPTVRRLEALGAELLGKEASLFVPSGTMANQIAIALHTRPGDAVVMEASAHPFHYEAGAASWLSGVTIRPVPGRRGQLSAAAVRAAVPPVNPHFTPVALVCAEDTGNAAGGTVYPLEVLDAVAVAARESGAGAHLDGARLFNAVVASGIPAARRAREYDTVSVCLSKGLGAPVGSLLAGREAVMERARRIRKAFGGGMRQSGILAAAGIHALEHHVEALAEDHRRALALARGLQELGRDVEPPETNMVYIREVPDARARVEELAAAGLLCVATGPEELRLVTHRDLDDAGVERALARLASLKR